MHRASSRKYRVWPGVSLSLLLSLRLPRQRPAGVAMPPQPLLVHSLAQQLVQRSPTPLCAVRGIAQRKRRTSARSWRRRARSGLLWASSLRPHHHPSHPRRTHRQCTNQPPRSLDQSHQYTATMTPALLSLLHRLERRKFPARVARSRSRQPPPATMHLHLHMYPCRDRRLQSPSR